MQLSRITDRLDTLHFQVMEDRTQRKLENGDLRNRICALESLAVEGQDRQDELAKLLLSLKNTMQRLTNKLDTSCIDASRSGQDMGVLKSPRGATSPLGASTGGVPVSSPFSYQGATTASRDCHSELSRLTGFMAQNQPENLRQWSSSVLNLRRSITEEQFMTDIQELRDMNLQHFEEVDKRDKVINHAVEVMNAFAAHSASAPSLDQRRQQQQRIPPLQLESRDLHQRSMQMQRNTSAPRATGHSPQCSQQAAPPSAPRSPRRKPALNVRPRPGGVYSPREYGEYSPQPAPHRQLSVNFPDR